MFFGICVFSYPVVVNMSHPGKVLDDNKKVRIMQSWIRRLQTSSSASGVSVLPISIASSVKQNPHRHQAEQQAVVAPIVRSSVDSGTSSYVIKGVLFQDMDQSVLFDPKIDPIYTSCFNCRKMGHNYKECHKPKTKYCCNCGRIGVTIYNCPRCFKGQKEFEKERGRRVERMPLRSKSKVRSTFDPKQVSRGDGSQQQSNNRETGREIQCSKNTPADYCKEKSREFHEAGKQSNSDRQPAKQHSFSKVNESELEQSLPRPERIVAWSSSSSLSSLSTGSLFSLTDLSPMPKKYKTTGVVFDNLDLVPVDPKVDPKPYVCYNCWQLDHEFTACTKVKSLYCRNCGRRGVAVENCPRCARAYTVFLNKLKNQYNAFFGSVEMRKPEKETKSVDDVPLNVIEERADECWDDFVEDDHRSSKASFSDSPQKRETECQFDDWDDYQSPRMNLVEKSSKVYSLNATKAEVAKLKDDSWDDSEIDNVTNSVSFIIPEEKAKFKDDNWNNCEMDSYSYSCENSVNKTNSASFIVPGEKPKYENEDQVDFNQGPCKDLWPSLDEKSYFESFTTLDNEKAEHESECWSNHDEEVFESSWKDSVSNSKTANLIINNKVENEVESWSDSDEYAFNNFQKVPTRECEAATMISYVNSSLQDQNNTWSDLKVEDVFRSPETFIIEFKKESLMNLENKKVQYEEEVWSDLEAYKSLQASFCEEYDTDNFMTAFNSRIDEEYWTDFDDDYQSLQASFADDYRSLNSTADDENDSTSILTTDVLHNEENPGFYESRDVSQNAESNKLFSFIENANSDDHFAAEQNCKNKVWHLNSLESSVNGHSDSEETGDYEGVIVDEDERSEPLLFAGHAVQDFLKLLDSLKHLPIQTQNLAVLHFIAKHREQSWHSQVPIK